ncbi:hypothetical protein [Chondromyces crocatus]|uniref:Gliding motility protein n=1 Tax=Chondromyces crocatus TaxID=52 RepID=A0A0K1ERN7_CHOCO|nr:hypothetical protein [Chondromyces crocatus]AKT43575.1 uncharacterized protein CMC5_078080 [Chondromyces crocatus]
MSPKKVVYVGPGFSGRRTSVVSVVRATGLRINPGVMNPDDVYLVEVGAGERLHLRISFARSVRHYNDAASLPADHPVQQELDWICEADGLVFIIDAQREREGANLEQFEHLTRDLRHRGLDLNDKPVVFQVNKRDLDSTSPLDEFRSVFGTRRCAFVESVASAGVGTREAILTLAALMHAG